MWGAKGQSATGWCGKTRVSRGACVRAYSVLKHLELHGPGLPLGHTNNEFLKVIGDAKFKLVYKCKKKKKKKGH
jgi:hypothetical protein